MFFHGYPYTDAHELNLDWLLTQIKAINSTLNNFIVMNTIKYADPFQWNITTQYESNTIVMEPNTGVAYISVQPVPAGISISNTDFWTAVFDLSLLFGNFNDNITFHNEHLNIVSAHVYPAGAWLIWKNELYLVTAAISLGDALQPGTNIERKTVEELVATLQSIVNTLSSDLTDLSNHVDDVERVLSGDITDINTKFDNMKVVNVLDHGVMGDGVTDDTAAIQAVIDDYDNCIIYFPAGTYLTGQITIPATSRITILGNSKTNTKFMANADNVSIFVCDQQSGYYSKSFKNLGFDSTHSGNTAFALTRMRNVSIDEIQFLNVANGIVLDRCVIANIHNIYQAYATANKFYSTVNNEYCFMVSIDGVYVDVVPAGWTSTILTFESCVNTYARNCNCMGLLGTSNFIDVFKKCEGVFLSDCVAVWPKIGFNFRIHNVGDTIPYGVWCDRVSVDQFAEHGFFIQGGWVSLNNFASVNSHDRSGTGYGVYIAAECQEVTLSNGYLHRNELDGIRFASGQSADSGIRVVNVISTDNGLGGGVDVYALNVYPHNPIFTNCKFNTHNVTGQILNDEGTSSFLYSNDTIIGNTTTGADEILATYTMPANTFNDLKHALKIHCSALLAVGTHAIGLTFGGLQIFGNVQTLATANFLVFDLTMKLDTDAATWIIDGVVTDANGSKNHIATSVANPSLDIIINIIGNSTAVDGIRLANYMIELI